MNAHVPPHLPAELLYDLSIAADNAVKRRDLPSLNALRIMDVNLEGALERSARNGYHEITQGLRNMNVDVTPLAVRYAVERSAESYWSLSDVDGVPAHPLVALDAAVVYSQWNLCSTLLNRFCIRPTSSIIERLHDERGVKRSKPPAEVVQGLFDGLLVETDFTVPVLQVAAQLLDASRFEKACKRVPSANLRALLVPAFIAGNTPNFYALMNAGVALDGALVQDFFAWPARDSDSRAREELSIAFIETLAANLGQTLSLMEVGSCSGDAHPGSSDPKSLTTQ